MASTYNGAADRGAFSFCLPVIGRIVVNRYSSLERKAPLRSKSKLRVKGVSEVSEIKDEIQSVLRDIVILRDGGCIFRNYPGHICSGFANDGHLILQADHLITRANAATYGDSRLVVCVCKGIHGWKSVGSNLRKKQYDRMVCTLLPTERIEFWDRCEEDSWRPVRTGVHDWKLILAALKQELRALQLQQ